MDSKSMFGIGIGVRLLMGLSNPRNIEECTEAGLYRAEILYDRVIKVSPR